MNKNAKAPEPEESPRGFISAPTREQLLPTPRESALLEQLWRWHEQSAKSQIMMGVPLKDQQ